MNDSYAKEFAAMADVARLGKADDVRISYAVYVGTPNSEGEDNFLGEEFFSVDNFTTWSDAAKAKMLVVDTLQKVDENLSMGLKLADVRDEVIAAIANTKIKHEDFLAATRAVNEIFDYYISHGE